MNRRRLLLGAGGTLAAGASLAAWRFWPEQGFWNPCRAGLPPHLASHELVAAAWQGLDATQVWDSHAHLLGIGDAGSGIYVNPATESLLSPDQYARRQFFLNAGCASGVPGGVDRAYVARLQSLMESLQGMKLLLYAFERAHDDRGEPDLASTMFHVPDAYAREVARAHPRHFEWVASIHPYASNAVERLAQAKRDGARAVKWIPSAMNIDPASPRCERFFESLQRLNLPLISHAGLERAVLGGRQDFGNPLRLRRALDAGVRVVVAHCASMGEDRDLEKGESGPYVQSSELFARMMQEKKYEKLLYGDISAMTQTNRANPWLVKVLERTEWHPRLLNGSDYPLPGVMPIFSVDYLASLGLLDRNSSKVLQEIRAHNPLLFDFVLKRHLRANGKALAASVFETRPFFMR